MFKKGHNYFIFSSAQSNTAGHGAVSRPSAHSWRNIMSAYWAGGAFSAFLLGLFSTFGLLTCTAVLAVVFNIWNEKW